MSVRVKLALAVVLGFGSLIFILVDVLLGDKPGASGPQSAPSFVPSTSASSESGQPRTTTTRGVSCAGMKQQSETAVPVDARKVYSAACMGDVQGLVQIARSVEGFTPHPDELKAIMDRNPEILQDIVRTLETDPVQDQGGSTYCLAEAGRMIFARGTHERTGVWSTYEPFVPNCAP